MPKTTKVKYRLKSGKIGNCFIEAYYKIEDCVVNTYKKIEDAFVNAFLERIDEDDSSDNK